MTEFEILTLKDDLDSIQYSQLNSSWGQYNKGRMYMKEIGNRRYQLLPRSLLNFIQACTSALTRLDAVYDPENNRHVHGPSFLKCVDTVTGSQGWHIDQYTRFSRTNVVEPDRPNESIKQLDISDFRSFLDLGYSIFIGLDKINSLLIASMNNDKQIIDAHRVEYSLGSILVITDNIIHSGDCFLGDNAVISRLNGVRFQLKMFMAVNEHGQITDGSVFQRWLHEDTDSDIVFRKIPMKK